MEVISSSARHLETPPGGGVSGSEAARTGISERHGSESKQRNRKNLSDDDLPHQLRRYLLAAVNKQQWAGGQTSCPVGSVCWLDGCQFESLGCF